MSTLGRTLKNFMRAGPASSWRQLQFIGDTKYGALIGTDAVGNKYFENNDEIYGMSFYEMGKSSLCLLFDWLGHELTIWS